MSGGRKAKVIRPVKKNISLPEDLVGKVDLELFSNVEGRVPTAAWQNLLIELLTNWLAQRYGGVAQGDQA